MVGSQCWVPGFDLMVWYHGWVLRLALKVGSKGWNQGKDPRLYTSVGSQDLRLGTLCLVPSMDPTVGPNVWSHGCIPLFLGRVPRPKAGYSILGYQGYVLS